MQGARRLVNMVLHVISTFQDNGGGDDTGVGKKAGG